MVSPNAHPCKGPFDQPPPYYDWIWLAQRTLRVSSRPGSQVASGSWPKVRNIRRSCRPRWPAPKCEAAKPEEPSRPIPRSPPPPPISSANQGLKVNAPMAACLAIPPGPSRGGPAWDVLGGHKAPRGPDASLGELNRPHTTSPQIVIYVGNIPPTSFFQGDIL